MKKLSLRERLLKYLLRQHGFISSRQIQEVVMHESKYLPRTAVRRLEEMVEDGLLDVEIRGKVAWYKARDGIAAPKEHNSEHIQGCGILKDYTYAV